MAFAAWGLAASLEVMGAAIGPLLSVVLLLRENTAGTHGWVEPVEPGCLDDAAVVLIT